MNTTFHSSNSNCESDFYSLKLPEYRKPKLELWAFLPLNDFDALLSCFDDNEFMKSTENNLQSNRNIEYKKFTTLIRQQLKFTEVTKKEEILIDKYYYLIKFGLANGFTKAQINCMLLIIKRTHELAMETSFGNLDETFDYFKKLLVINAVHRPPYSVQMFTMKQIETITAYVFETYFNQFKFYKYVFSLAVRLDLKLKYSNLPAEVVETEETSQSNNDLMNDLVDGNKTEETQATETSTDIKEKEEQSELKEFIRNYLGDKLKKMKEELNEELNPKTKKK